MIRRFLSCLLATAAFALPAGAWAQFQVNDGTNRGTCNSFSFASGVLSLSPSGCLAGPAPVGPVFSFGTGNPTSISENYAAGMANRAAAFTVHVERNGSTSALTVDVEICPASTGCTAVGGLDFQLDATYPPAPPFRRTLSFAPGETDRTFDVHIVDDASQDGNKTLTLGLSNASGGATIAAATATVSLVDDDIPAAGTVAWALSAFGVSEADGAGIAALPINRSTTAGTASVQVEIVAANTTAVVGTNYNVNNTNTPFSGNPLTTTVTFANGAATGYVFLPIINNPTVETAKTVALNLKNPVGLSIASPSSTVLTINDAGGGGGVDLDINGAPIPPGPVGASMCEQVAPVFPGGGPGPCGSYQIPLGNCSSGMSGANAISKAWLYILEDYPGARIGNSIRVGIPRDNAMVFRFKTGPAGNFPEFSTTGYRFFGLGYSEQVNRGPSAARFVTLSESKCDFDYTKTLANSTLNGCYKTMTGDDSLLGKVYPAGSAPAPSADFPYCPLKPDTVYYLNIRYEDASSVGTRGLLSCPVGQGPLGSSQCGAAIGFN
jgi:hypothetical protein